MPITYRQDKISESIANLLGRQELVRLTPDNVDSLASTIEQSCKYIDLVPIKIHRSGDNCTAIVGCAVGIDVLRKREFPGAESQNYLEVGVVGGGFASALHSVFYYNSDELLTYYSLIPVSENNPHCFWGLYLKREDLRRCDDPIDDSEQLLLKVPFCEKNLPEVFSDYIAANGYEEGRQNAIAENNGKSPVFNKKSDENHTSTGKIQIPQVPLFYI